MKIANIDRESLRIFWTSWGISMKFLDVTYDNFKVTKKQGFTISSADAFFKTKPQEEGGYWPPAPAFLGLRNFPWACGQFLPETSKLLIFVKYKTSDFHLYKYYAAKQFF